MLIWSVFFFVAFFCWLFLRRKFSYHEIFRVTILTLLSPIGASGIFMAIFDSIRNGKLSFENLGLAFVSLGWYVMVIRTFVYFQDLKEIKKMDKDFVEMQIKEQRLELDKKRYLEVKRLLENTKLSMGEIGRKIGVSTYIVQQVKTGHYKGKFIEEE